MGAVYGRKAVCVVLNCVPAVKRSGTGLDSTDLDLRRTIFVVPKASPSKLIPISAALGFFSRAMTSLPFTFVKYVRPAGMIVSLSDSSKESSLLRGRYLNVSLIRIRPKKVKDEGAGCLEKQRKTYNVSILMLWWLIE